MAKNSFRDPQTGVLKAYGFMELNEPGDVKQSESETFSLEPSKWRWNGTAWVAFVSPPLPPNPLKALIVAAVTDPAVPPSLKALLAAWQSQL